MAAGTRVQPPAEKDLSTQGHEARACNDSGGRAWPKAHASNPPLADTLGRRASAQQNDGVPGQREEGVARVTRVQPPAEKDLGTQDARASSHGARHTNDTRRSGATCGGKRQHADNQTEKQGENRQENNTRSRGNFRSGRKTRKAVNLPA